MSIYDDLESKMTRIPLADSDGIYCSVCIEARRKFGLRPGPTFLAKVRVGIEINDEIQVFDACNDHRRILENEVRDILDPEWRTKEQTENTVESCIPNLTSPSALERRILKSDTISPLKRFTNH